MSTTQDLVIRQPKDKSKPESEPEEFPSLFGRVDTSNFPVQLNMQILQVSVTETSHAGPHLAAIQRGMYSPIVRLVINDPTASLKNTRQEEPPAQLSTFYIHTELLRSLSPLLSTRIQRLETSATGDPLTLPFDRVIGGSSTMANFLQWAYTENYTYAQPPDEQRHTPPNEETHSTIIDACLYVFADRIDVPLLKSYSSKNLLVHLDRDLSSPDAIVRRFALQAIRLSLENLKFGETKTRAIGHDLDPVMITIDQVTSISTDDNERLLKLILYVVNRKYKAVRGMQEFHELMEGFPRFARPLLSWLEPGRWK